MIIHIIYVIDEGRGQSVVCNKMYAVYQINNYCTVITVDHPVHVLEIKNDFKVKNRVSGVAF